MLPNEILRLGKGTDTASNFQTGRETKTNTPDPWVGGREAHPPCSQITSSEHNL